MNEPPEYQAIMKILLSFFVVFCMAFGCEKTQAPIPDPPMTGDPVVEFQDTLRFASYNVAMYGQSAGDVLNNLENADQQITYRRLAAVIKNVKPDILVLMEIDFDDSGQILKLFNDNLLKIDLDGFEGLDYPYLYQIETNTGELAEVDIDDNGTISLPNDAFGFGNYPGQYASAILSKFPIDIDKQRSFRKLLWKDMPGASLPANVDGSSYYTPEVLEAFRLSSKNHIDLPLQIAEGIEIHALISHPTPPVFDGAEDRNGKRNHDEIKLWADYISNESYLVDDQGASGGLAADQSFIIFGDLNADPVDGDSFNNAIQQLLDHPRVNQEVSNGDLIPASNGGAEHNQGSGNLGDPKFDTSFFGLRIDYVLPSSDLNAINSGVFWPSSQEDDHELVKDGAASDHLLVWVDIEF